MTIQNLKRHLLPLALIGFMCGSLVLWGCKRETPVEKAEPGHGAEASPADDDMNTEHTAQDEHGDERLVRLSSQDLREFGITIETATSGKLPITLKLPGEITYNADRVAHIVPRFPGLVKEVRKQLGDRVEKNEVLALIESSESLSPYEVVSLIEGTIVAKHVTLGEVVNTDAEIYQVANLSTVWLNLTVYQKDLPHVRTGQQVFVSAGPGVPEVKGTISYISPVVDEHTRTARARTVLANEDGALKPGLFVTARVVLTSVDVPIAVPRTAVQTLDDRECVFVKTPEGFVPEPVVVGRSNDTHVEIVSGLEKDQAYVVQGAFTLKAQLSKGAFGAGHNH